MQSSKPRNQRFKIIERKKVPCEKRAFDFISGAVLICTGLANLLHFSLILATIVLGMTVANIFSLSGRRTFEAIRSITIPIYIAFFVLTGAHLQKLYSGTK